MIGVRGLLAIAAVSSFGCGQEPSGPADPSRVAEGGGAPPPVFHVRDSGFVHVGIGRSVELRVSAAGGAHPLRPSTRQLVSTSWTSRDSTVAAVQSGVLRGRREGMTWLVWSHGAALDSTPLVVSAPPVGYLAPRQLAIDVNAAATTFTAPAGDSLLFCSNPPAGSGVELSGTSGVRSTKNARVAVRCRTRGGVTGALVLSTNAATTPPTDLDPGVPPGPQPPPAPQPPAPPPAGARTVTLQLHRFAGAEQASVSSNAIPLPPGWVRPTALDSVSLRVGSVEVPVRVTALHGKHADGSLRSIHIQTTVTPAMLAGGATLVIGVRRTQVAAAVSPAAGPTAVLLPSDVAYLVSTEVVGKTALQSAIRGASPAFQAFESTFHTYQQRLWSQYGDVWTQNFYDRALAYFAFWVRTGRPEYFERGARLAIAYRRDYLEANAYGAAEWWSYLEGLAVHYWLTGDAASREAVFRTAWSLNSGRGGAQLANFATHPWMDNRVQAKVLGSKIIAAMVEAPPMAGISDWRAAATTDVGLILSTQAPDGAYRFGNICNESSNFMGGILGSVLVLYYAEIAKDPRVLTAVRNNMRFMRETQWIPSEKVFKYYSGPCATGGPEPANDLNGLFLESIGWLAHETRDDSWFAFGDVVLEGMMEKTWFDGSKQFTQAYTMSWRYHYFRSLRQ